MPEREQGGIDSRQWPQTAADLAELEAEARDRRGEPHAGGGVTVSDHLEAGGAARAFGFNGRETAAYVLGFWQRHLRDAQQAGYYDQPEGERLALEILPTILEDHLPAVAALLIRAGATVDVHHSPNEGVLTLRVSTR